MTRAAIERRRTMRQWRSRRDDDEPLQPGRFRKGRRPTGCPRRCVFCRAIKLYPTRQILQSDLSLQEWHTEGGK
jgi:hypothetical protein